MSFNKKTVYLHRKGSLYAISKGNGVQIPDCLAAVNSFIASGKNPLPYTGGKEPESGIKSEDLPFQVTISVNLPTTLDVRVNGETMFFFQRMYGYFEIPLHYCPE